MQKPATPMARRTRAGRSMIEAAFNNVVEAVVNSPLFKQAEKPAEKPAVLPVRSSRLRALAA